MYRDARNILLHQNMLEEAIILPGELLLSIQKLWNSLLSRCVLLIFHLACLVVAFPSMALPTPVGNQLGLHKVHAEVGQGLN